MIAIQTPHYAPNYGAQLQAWALGEAVRTLGLEVEYINRRPSYFYDKVNPFSRMYRFLEKQLHFRYFIDFENKYLQPQTIQITHNSEYSKLDLSKYSAIIVGSDQIWRDDYFYSSFEYSPYLYFVDNPRIRKVAYAASFGKDSYNAPIDRHEQIKKLMSQFYAISLREESGVTLLNDKFGLKGTWVADPTILHTGDFYTKFFSLTDTKKNQIGTYVIGNSSEHMRKIDFIAKIMGYKTSHIYKNYDRWYLPTFLSDRLKPLYVVPSVLDWLDTVKNSEYIITDSFHGMVFCILFHKRFVVYNNKKGGSARFISLLNKVGLSDRLIDWDSPYNTCIEKLETEIDYTRVDYLLNEFRSFSINFLKQALIR